MKTPMNHGKKIETEPQSEISKLPKTHIVMQKCLHCGNERVDINHFDDDLDKPLNYEEAAKKMNEKLRKAAKKK